MPADVQPRDSEVPYLIGRGPCVAIEQGRTVTTGTHLLAIASGKQPADTTVEELRPWPGRSYGGPRRPRTDCTSWFDEDITDDSGDRVVQIASLARVSNAWGEPETFFALDVQAPHIIIPGTPKRVGRAEALRLLESVRRSLPASWAPARTLVRAERYGPAHDHEVVELSVGWPTRNRQGVTPPIKHVEIRRFFFVDGRVAASEAFDRTSGVEERADTEAPQLTDDNWSVLDTETTVAYVSRDGAASWERLSTNIGFETTIWFVHALREGVPVVFRRDLYTHH